MKPCHGFVSSARSEIYQGSREITNFFNASIGKEYDGSVSRGQEDIYHFVFYTPDHGEKKVSIMDSQVIISEYLARIR